MALDSVLIYVHNSTVVLFFFKCVELQMAAKSGLNAFEAWRRMSLLTVWRWEKINYWVLSMNDFLTPGDLVILNVGIV